MRFIPFVLCFTTFIGLSFAYNHPACQSRESLSNFFRDKSIKLINEACNDKKFPININKIKSMMMAKEKKGDFLGLYNPTCGECKNISKEECSALFRVAYTGLQIAYYDIVKKEDCK